VSCQGRKGGREESLFKVSYEKDERRKLGEKSREILRGVGDAGARYREHTVRGGGE